MILRPKGNTPRWVILSVDILLSLLALAIAYAIRFDFVQPESDQLQSEWEVLKPSLLIYLVVRIGSFLITKTYSGIIRFTSTQDAKRIFLTILGGSIIFGLVSVIRYFFFDGFFMLPISIMVLEFVFAFMLLLAMRVAVKLLYIEQNKSRGATKSVVIYGAGDMGMATKKILEQDVNTLYNIIGFIDDNKSLQGKYLERTPIKSPNYLDKWAEKKEIDTLIIAINNPHPEKKRAIIQKSLELNLDLLSTPPLHQWSNGEFNTKLIKKVNIEDLLGRKEIKLHTDNIYKYLHDKVILVTGGAGSIGSELARQVIQYGPKKLILLDQAETPIYELSNELNNTFKQTDFEVVIADVSDRSRMKTVFDHFQPQIVFHAAAYKHVPLMEENPSEAIKTNVEGTKILADLSDEFNCESFVMISTDKAVNPTNVMGASKRIAEIYVQALDKNSSTKFTTTRFGNVLGSNGSVIPIFKKQIEQGGPVTVTDERITRFFMTIPEACQLVLEAGTMGTGGEIYVFDMGDSIRIIDLAKQMIKLSGFEVDKDIKIEITGLRPGEKLYEELLTTEENTIPTHHEKILIGKVKEYAFEEVSPKILALINSYAEQNNESMVKQMKALVPEFISNNSVFSKFDK
ncbi:polysaccharide biosynthesis protein [Parvicella tangerina]|uniref:UDP-N-acetyl-alpha-D-glucosamine C6 dehydratase n=1 Tax=Parvicella tangerina TaxID=2829795 RepID=A0A916NGP4_9FLAO|nr:nucleoside-diphosphate sugar epimerase/dehydratase [Parvicella tangerina]CAG5080994.1 UDP-N-acetyl-alpha-D-glucosamine C6 dehydratase [Parvicella tangerina]